MRTLLIFLILLFATVVARCDAVLDSGRLTNEGHAFITGYTGYIDPTFSTSYTCPPDCAYITSSGQPPIVPPILLDNPPPSDPGHAIVTSGPPTNAPEPSMNLMLLFGLGALIIASRYKRKSLTNNYS